MEYYRKKFEIATDEIGTPIKQDTKKGKLREVSYTSFFAMSANLTMDFLAKCFLSFYLDILCNYSSKKEISSSTMDAFPKHGRTLLISTPMLTAQEVRMCAESALHHLSPAKKIDSNFMFFVKVTMILLTSAKSELELFHAVEFVL